MVTTKLITANDLAAMPDDGYRYRLIRGELIRVSPVDLTHFRVTNNITVPLSLFVRERGLGIVGGEGGFILEVGPDTVLAPDVAFIRTDQIPPEDQQHGFARLVPDLVVEVVSTSDRAGEMAEKTAIYLQAGVPLLWWVFPKQRLVRQHTPDGGVAEFRAGDLLDGGTVLPGFQLPVAQIFR